MYIIAPYIRLGTNNGKKMDKEGEEGKTTS